ncbi:hypothetical protein A4L_13 [Anabaena phage A-4L]|uniref:Uncharacterized protein n=1 Tax=Anabaena phage A-4L TaxID=1357732 RepID=A0A059PY88_9CAUD|nr:hypothetical protein A4L_13 [Anabaena phage A-4L]AGR48540.1 hypothetical protein A4L_13 [Anabaena phage A-4L]
MPKLNKVLYTIELIALIICVLAYGLNGLFWWLLFELTWVLIDDLLE